MAVLTIVGHDEVFLRYFLDAVEVSHRQCRLLSDVDSTCVSVRQSASEQLCEAMDHRLGRLATVRRMWDIERSAGTVYPPRTKPAACTQHSAVTSHWTRSETWSHMHTNTTFNRQCQMPTNSSIHIRVSMKLCSCQDN